MACKKYLIEELQHLRNMWADIPVEVIAEKHQDTYKKRKIAVDMYIDGQNLVNITKRTGIRETKISALIDKCLTPKTDGSYYGYEGLIPGKHISQNRYSSKNFSKLLQDYPALQDYISGCYFGDKKYTLEKNMNLKTLHERFLAKCLEIGVQNYEYPFNTYNKAYVSLTKYVKSLKTIELDKQAQRESKDNMQKIHSTGYGHRYTKNSIMPFGTVQIDGHIIDLEYCVEIYNTDGTIDKIIATRAWIIAVIDVATRCILGFSVSQEFNYNQYDVLDALKNALEPRKQMDFKITGLEYPKNYGYVSMVYPELQYAMFETVMLDNAKAHLAQNTITKIVDELKCSINFGSVATPETRGIVERFFCSLETRGFHRLPSTTGSNIKDLKRKNPEQAAVKYDVTYDQIIELLEVLIADYNNTKHGGIDNLTPLECMRKRCFDAGMLPTIAEDEMVRTIDKLNYRIETRNVVGGKNGKRPYINFKGVEYRSNELSSNNVYLGQKITIKYNPRDISTVEAYTKDGNYIGTLYAKGEFGQKSHSLKTRENALKLARKRGHDKLEFNMPITAYEQHLNEAGKSNRKEATKADIIRREQGIKPYSELEKTPIANIHDLHKEDKKQQLPSYEELEGLSLEEQYEKLFGKKVSQ